MDSQETFVALPSQDDSSTTKAELQQRAQGYEDEHEDAPAAKRVKVDSKPENHGGGGRTKGSAPIKAEYLVTDTAAAAHDSGGPADDDAAEQKHHDRPPKREKQRGQNKNRKFGKSNDVVSLCSSRAYHPEFSPADCSFGDSCRFEHDLRKYLKEHKRADLGTFGGECPVWEAEGRCAAGFKCRFVGSHMKEIKHEDGREELVLTEKEGKAGGPADGETDGVRTVNLVTAGQKQDLAKKKMKTPKSDGYMKWLEQTTDRGDARKADDSHAMDNRAAYREPPLLPSEKKKLYFGRDTPVLAPLTTQGNLPYRRLCVDLGAQLTYSEMAMGLPLIQGQKSEWALMKSHEDELTSPAYIADDALPGYDSSKDIKFGAQISGNKPWLTCRTTEILTTLCPHLRVVDLNCGCPIDLVFKNGAGSALLDQHSKLEKMLYGMNVVSGQVPITCKIRMGTRDGKPTALKLVNRLVNGHHGEEGADPGETTRSSSGVAAITLHGRSRQQRYTRSADWSYISDCAALIKRHKRDSDAAADTAREGDGRDQPAAGRVYFLGNGDCYSHVDYHAHLDGAGVDAVMIGRGGLIKPWLFEEIAAGQYLDKSATERLRYVEQYCRYGLQAWGADEMGVGATRRFLLEWLSFAHRYIPIGLLEHLPPNLQDRPPRYKGRNELETLLASEHYEDWIKISEMFLGPVAEGFRFQPKHKSNSYDKGGQDYVAEG